MHKKKNVCNDLSESLANFLQVISAQFETLSPLLVSLFSLLIS